MLAALKKNRELTVLLLYTAFVFILFFHISRLTPLAGDDWGYAVTGRTENPFAAAWSFYFTWSGRYFSELWGFIVAPRKWLWNILNPCLFSGIYYSLYRLVSPKKNQILCMTVLLGLMLSVQQVLRIETYTWIMGSTYVIPLLLTLVYLNLIRPVLLEEQEFSRGRWFLCLFLNFYIGLCMENIAGGLILANLMMLVYAWFRRRPLFRRLLVLTAVSCLSFALLRMSPGSNFRLYRDNQAWLSMSLPAKIQANWNAFLSYTFTENTWMMTGLSLVLLCAALKLRRMPGRHAGLAAVIAANILCLLASFAPLLYRKTGMSFWLMLYDHADTRSAAVFCTVFYPLYVISVYYELHLLFQKTDRFWEAMLYLTVGGACNAAMLLSPIFGARSSLYTVYFLFVLLLFVLGTVDFDRKTQIIGIVLFALLAAQRTRVYLYQYNAVHARQVIRNSEIAYYVDHPEVKEAWLIRMPAGFIHSADIEEGDDYHMSSFKKYYGIAEDVHLVFYKPQ
jgi:hypothetical protein